MTGPGFPGDDVEVTQLLVVSDVARSRRFYTDVLGAELQREYGGDSAVLRFQGAWLLLVSGGEPTPGKPTVRLRAAGRSGPGQSPAHDAGVGLPGRLRGP